MPKKDRGGVERGSEIYRDKAQRKTLKKSKRGKSGSGKKERGEEDEAAQSVRGWAFSTGAAQAAVLATMTLQGQQQQQAKKQQSSLIHVAFSLLILSILSSF
ncbi:uncharacterized protein AFUA_2G09920 [Aspergillus fumigatus Af293]|uniref:Uncharacterized protein n=2 Tax=Aspergillus fumigatus TaxID=746128 RepID=Q4X1H8_ASPFU|nr:hypothetical protein AFUA_2G09920 [Aspergillus fumigatus Af293]EAL93287.1 hypothetical protein AFUA_2G09920 [Aspergillus fumigatus Af293]EDP54519.1 hypothetical protein AFUB_025760 [Aspergillus fumigatus A1163]KEY79545.1 hypothetical protein BA78_8658 [Aspergillus fumigatus]